MYPFAQAVTPALKTHIDAQTDYFNDISKSLFRSFQQVCDLNLKLMQALFEETTLAGQQLMKTGPQADMLSAAAARAQPATEKLHAWQQHMARVAADAQVDMARVTEQHAQTTARTARAVADDVARTTTEQAEGAIQAEQENVRRFADPHNAQHAAGAGQPSGARAPEHT